MPNGVLGQYGGTQPQLGGQPQLGAGGPVTGTDEQYPTGMLPPMPQGGGGAFGGAGSDYEKWMREAQEELARQQAQGRGDIEQWFQRGAGYGEPYRKGGEEAWQAYLGSMGAGGPGAYQAALSKFKLSPGYQAALASAQQGTQRGLAARGGLQSGAEQRELARQAQTGAQSEFGQWQQQLGQAAGMGQQAAAQAAGAAWGMGPEEARMGTQYAQMGTGVYEQMAQEQAEREAAERAAEAAKKGGIWGALGRLGGSIFGGSKPWWTGK